MNNFIYVLKYRKIPIYAGSTNNPTKRRWGHKSDCFNQNTHHYNDMPVYPYIRSLGITPETYYDEIELEVIYENIPFEYLKQMEQWVICNYKDFYGIQNVQGVNVSRKEYYFFYSKENAEKLKQKRELNKQEKSEYDKEYRLNNLEKRRQQCKDWFAVNREANNKRMVRPKECNKCHKMISHCNMKRHQKSSNCV
jgi:predicted GIY-YIG superfamily endonuclease